MARQQRSVGGLAGFGRWLALAVVAGCVGLGGCRWFDLGGNKLDQDKAYDLPREMRPVEKDSDFSGLSNKSRQIESNLGVGGRR